MPINGRQKGHDFERKVASDLNTCVNIVLLERDCGVLSRPYVQRNQNQSAVGGKDLINTFGLAIECKASEVLSIPAWWDQCVTSARRSSEQPVLIYKQNRKKPVAMTMGELWLSPTKKRWTLVSFSYDDFLDWFTQIVRLKLEEGFRMEV